MQLIYLTSLILGIVGYLFLTVFCIVTWRRGITGRAVIIAATSTLLYLLSQALTGIGALALSLQALTLLAWIGLLTRVIGFGPGSVRQPGFSQVNLIVLAALALGAIAAAYPWFTAAGTGPTLPLGGLFVSQLLLAVCGLILLEQVVRNTRDDLRWRLRYLNIGLGTLFAFQIVHNACGLLFNAYLPALLVIQPAVFAALVPFIALASMRNPDSPLRLNLSRRFVFGSGVLVATGSLLLVMGLFGYLARLTGGDWLMALLALLAVLGCMAGAAVLGSAQVRLRVRRWVEENLFPAKYDYREEWRRVTGQLTEPSPDYDLNQQTLRALAGVFKSNAGAIWRLSEAGILVPEGRWHTAWSSALTPATSGILKEVFEEQETLIDLDDLSPQTAARLAGCADLFAMDKLRFVVPLLTGSKLFGIAAVSQPPFPLRLDWEDRALVTLIARQAAGFVALQEADRELAEAEKLRGLNQLSAFLIHDVKTVTSQLQLLVANAEKHKSNPAFIDDMVQTVDNAARRLGKLLGQLRGDEPLQSAARIELAEQVRAVVDGFAASEPQPQLHVEAGNVTVLADPSQLRSTIGHLIQNAIDASNQPSPDGRAPNVCVSLHHRPPWAEITVTDNGPGMAESFISDSLFQPFNSTKGVAGMGIGAYQARTFARAQGGDVQAQSRLGVGSSFTLKLPLADKDG